MAGYSGTPLAKKLGIAKPGQLIALIDAPVGFGGTLGELPNGVEISTGIAPTCRYDVIVYFVDSRSKLERCLPLLRASLKPDGGLWIAWPKKASKAPTDVTEDVIRDFALKKKLVDNKVCAIDEIWSGLRLVIPIQHRPKKAKR